MVGEDAAECLPGGRWMNHLSLQGSSHKPQQPCWRGQADSTVSKIKVQFALLAASDSSW